MNISDLKVNDYFIYQYGDYLFLAKAVKYSHFDKMFRCTDEFCFEYSRTQEYSGSFNLFLDTNLYTIRKIFDESFDPHDVYPEYYI